MAFTKIETVNLEEIAAANALDSLTTQEQKLGASLYDAFHDKSNPELLKNLIAEGAPVNYRLDYGLEIRREADFVYQFFLLLEGDLGIGKLAENAKLIFGENYSGYVSYLKFSKEYYEILHSPQANTKNIPLNSAYENTLKKYAIAGRANPNHNNSALIIAAGLNNYKLVEELLEIGKKTSVKPEHNGSHVNFKGYFDDTAIIWAAILLDFNTIKVLMNHGADFEDIGVSKASVLHWVTLAQRINPSPERTKTAKDIVEFLIEHQVNILSENLLRKTPLDYANHEFKQYLTEKSAISYLSPSFC